MVANMLIKEIEIQNFKCIKNLHITELTPIVGIWGKNGTGKSTILQALVVLKNAAQGGDYFNSNGISLGKILFTCIIICCPVNYE